MISLDRDNWAQRRRVKAARAIKVPGDVDPLQLAIDAVGGAITLRLADCLAEGGILVNYGLLSGEPCMLSSHHSVFRGLTLTGFWLVKALGALAPGEVTALYGDLAGRIADGSLRVPVEATYPIEEIGPAVAHGARAGRSGKVLVTPNGPID